MTTASRTKRLVWDLPVRLVHWGLVLCIVGSWATAEAGFDWTDVHFWFGYTALGLVLFRLVWGFIGPPHARFSNFLAGTRRLLAHLYALKSRAAEPSVGHTPLGGWMSVILLLLIGSQATIGLFISDDIFYSGPYNGAVSSDTASALAGWHHRIFDVLTVLVVVHIGAVLWYRLWKRQPLTAAMVHGRKAAPEDADIGSSMLARALILALIVASLVTALVMLAPPPAVADFY